MLSKIELTEVEKMREAAKHSQQACLSGKKEDRGGKRESGIEGREREKTMRRGSLLFFNNSIDP